MTKNRLKVLTLMTLTIPLLISLVACGGSNSDKEGSSPASSAVVTESAAASDQPKASDDNSADGMKWSEKLIENEGGLFKVNSPEGWTFVSDTYINYGTYNEDWDNIKMLIYGDNKSAPESLTLEGLPEFFAPLVDRDFSYLPRFSLSGEKQLKFDNTEKVNINGAEMLKVRGNVVVKDRQDSPEIKFIGYFGFNTNDEDEYRSVVHTPIYLITFVKSPDDAKLKYGEQVLDAMVGTMGNIVY